MAGTPVSRGHVREVELLAIGNGGHVQEPREVREVLDQGLGPYLFGEIRVDVRIELLLRVLGVIDLR